MGNIKIEEISAILRSKTVNLENQTVLISKIKNSLQEKDLTVPTNCNGYGRIHHFSQARASGWTPDPLPIVPATKGLNLPFSTSMRAQIFQLAACNFHCWYCYVDPVCLSADMNYARFFSADELVEMYLLEDSPPSIIDISGGQPDIVPEWTYWMAQAIESHNLYGRVYLWIDDNLSTDFLWKYLSEDERQYLVRYPASSRVGCFKGYDPTSFSFNTRMNPKRFEFQFEIFARLLHEGFDMYGYVTFTARKDRHIQRNMKKFIDKLQAIHENLPLRTIPLLIEEYTPLKNNIMDNYFEALFYQHHVHSVWNYELNQRYSESEIRETITNISLK